MRYFTLILIALIINGCYLLNFEKHHWKEQYSIQPNTGIFIGKFALMGGFKDKQVVFYLIDSSRVKKDSITVGSGLVTDNKSAIRYAQSPHEPVIGGDNNIKPPFCAL